MLVIRSFSVLYRWGKTRESAGSRSSQGNFATLVFFNDNSPTDEGLGRLGVLGTANSIPHILFPSHPAIPRTVVLEKNPKARWLRSARIWLRSAPRLFVARCDAV